MKRYRRIGGIAGLAAAVLLVAVLVAVGPAGPAGAPPEAGPVPATVTIVGGTGGPGEPVLPSGQPLAYQAVPGWGLPAAAAPGPAAVAGDGTVFMAGHDGPGRAAPVIGAYQPATGEFTTIQLAAPSGGTAPAGSVAPSGGAVAALAAVAGGEAVAATIASGGSGLAILTTVDGRWTVAAGDGWVNRWPAAALGATDAPWGDLVALPASGDVIVAVAAGASEHSGSLLALRIAGPGPDGQVAVTVTGRYRYPDVRDPVTGSHLQLDLRDLRADPTGQAGQERFVVGLHQRDAPIDGTGQPPVRQEFGYDAATGAITPVSAPILPGDRSGGESGTRHFGYSAALYDHAGNLWAARSLGLAGGALAVYLGGPDCPPDPGREVGDLVIAGDHPVWGQECRPDIDLLQAKELPAIFSLMADPASTDVVALSVAGGLLPVRPSGTGRALTFQIGNLVDTAPALLPGGATAAGSPLLWPGGFDGAGRLWLAASQPSGSGDGTVGADQWLYAVAVADLFDPAPVRLTDIPGQATIVQAGHTSTVGTEQLPGTWATVEVNSAAYVRTCTESVPASVGCSHDGIAGNGFVLGHRTGFGHLEGEVGYRVEVPVAGRYRVGYRVLTFEVTTGAAITFAVGDQSHTTPVSTGGRWRTVSQPDPVHLPAGVHSIQLSPPAGQGGWYLSWFSLQRA